MTLGYGQQEEQFGSLDEIFQAALAEAQSESKPAIPEAQAPAVEEPAAEEAPVVEEEETPAQEEEVVEEAAGEEPEAAEEDTGKGFNLEAKRIRVQPDDEVEAFAYTLKRAAKARGEKMDIGEAYRRANLAINGEAKAVAAPVAPVIELPAGAPRESQGILDRIEALQGQIETFADDYEPEKVKELVAEVRQLTKALPKIQAEELRSYADAEAQADAAFNSSMERARSLYPDMAEPTSTLYKEALALYNATPDGAYGSDPYEAVLETAKRLRIPVNTRTTRPTPPKPKNPPAASPSPVAKKGPAPASANSLAPSAVNSVEDQVDKAFNAYQTGGGGFRIR